MSLDIDYYELLEVEKTCDDGTLKSAYRRQAMRFHPDRNPGCAESEARFKAVNEAYDCLKDPQKRAAYDRFGKAAFQNGGMGAGGAEFGDIGDIFESIFGGAFGGGAGPRRGPARGADLRYDMQISLEEAFAGKQAEVDVEVAVACATCSGSGAKPGTQLKRCGTCAGHGKVRAQQGFFMVERMCPSCGGRGEVIADPCGSCHGEGRVDRRKTLSVNIPPGVDEGTRIRLAGEGEAGPRGLPPGDLYIFLHVAAHPTFAREGTTLIARLPVSFATAALGGTLQLDGLGGEAHEVRVPAGIQSGKQLRIRGGGMPVLNGRGRGDLIVEVAVTTPTKLSTRQRELLEQLRETEDEEPEGFFDKVKGMWGG